jgi:hypothetical protein
MATLPDRLRPKALAADRVVNRSLTIFRPKNGPLGSPPGYQIALNIRFGSVVNGLISLLIEYQ